MTGAGMAWARLIRLTAPVAVLICVTAALDEDARSTRFGASSSATAGAFEFRGFSYPSYHDGTYATPASALALRAAAAAGANFVAIVPTRYSRTIHDAEFFATEGTESDANILKAIADAHAAGLAVLLKPHVDPADGKPRAYYAPADPDAWFRNYEAFLLRYARLAAESRAEMFAIGCELDSLVGPPYRARWLHIIGALRAVYSGPLLYASGGAAGGEEPSFWDAVDYIGVDAYNPLSNARDPSVAELAAGWTRVPSGSWARSLTGGAAPLAYFLRLAQTYGKPVIFSEIGYKSIAGAAARPGDWKFKGPVDLGVQARAYEAFFEVWSRQSSWMKGAFLWNWEPEPHPERSAAGLAGYTPQNKPAAAVISRWYGAMAGATPRGAPSAGRR
jgi:hypothetical protein